MADSAGYIRATVKNDEIIYRGVKGKTLDEVRVNHDEGITYVELMFEDFTYMELKLGLHLIVRPTLLQDVNGEYEIVARGKSLEL